MTAHGRERAPRRPPCRPKIFKPKVNYFTLGWPTRMARVQLTKRVAALLLLASFFLPLSQCSLPATDAETGTKAVPGIAADVSGFSAYEWPSIGSTVAAALFGWAALIQLLSLRSPGLESNRAVFALELTLCVLTVAGISWVVYSWGQNIRYGAVLAYAAVLAYLAATIAGRNVKGHPNSTPHADARAAAMLDQPPSARAGERGR
jgi:hypothetical protein